MLDVHPPHETIHSWRAFLLHILTITIGLLIALGLEAMVESFHHRSEVKETREALEKELVENHKRFASDARFFQEETIVLRNDFVLLRALKLRPEVPASQLAGLALRSSYARMEEVAWKTAQSTAVVALMSQGEVRRTAELYGFFERMDRAHEEEADAIAVAFTYISEARHIKTVRDADVKTIDTLLRQVAAKHLRHGFLMQNLAEEYADFRPAPTREELEAYLQ